MKLRVHLYFKFSETIAIAWIIDILSCEVKLELQS